MEWLAYVTEAPLSPNSTALSRPSQLSKGVEEFNAESFFESHETWEGAWQTVAYPERLFFLALTKIAAGFAHAKRGNATGARRLLNDGLRFMGPFTPTFMGLDTRLLNEETRQWMDARPGNSNVAYPLIHSERS
jgi:predicted metal-dependent hydrolase